MDALECELLLHLRYCAIDRNIRNTNIKSFCADGYVLKFLNSFDSKKIAFVEGQVALSLYLSEYECVYLGENARDNELGTWCAALTEMFSSD